MLFCVIVIHTCTLVDSPKVSKPTKSAATVDDFVPEGGEVESFLEDSDEEEEEEDSEEDR